MNEFKSILSKVPEDDMGNVSVTCYMVRGKTLSYWHEPLIFSDCDEAEQYFNRLIKSDINGEKTT